MRTVTLEGSVGGGYPSVSPAPAGAGRRLVGGRRLALSSDVFHLYVLLALELALTLALRGWSRNHHGG